MSENENANANASPIADTVNSMTINTYSTIPTARDVEDVSLEAVQLRWKNIFSKYSLQQITIIKIKKTEINLF